jgi:hypothetical protein
VRSAEELRARWLDLIAGIMKRTAMYAATGSEMQLLARQLLMDLCFLDDRDADAEREWSRLVRTYGQRGVVGPFEAMFESPRCQAEVASVFAEVFYRLGYLSVGNRVGRDEWQEKTARLRSWFEDRDVTRDDAKVLLGAPSLVIDQRVLCYVPAESAVGWLFIDCHAEQVRRYDVGRGRYTALDRTESLVRSVRVSGESFESGLILTLYGKTLRWGPGWWLDHPGQDAPAGQAAIAAQLRQIRDADPSQSVRRQGN